MNIEAQAKDYKDARSIFFGVYRSIDVSDLEDAFYDGAKWMQEEMVEKALTWLKHQKDEIGISWSEDFEIRFRKAMGE